MIISTGRKYIFVHIPKTGGTSMALALEDRAMKDDILLGDTPKAVRRRGRLKNMSAAGRLWKHSALADIDGLLPGQSLDGMFIFALVRNPWDRMVSYYHWLRDQRFDHPAVHLARARDFEGFVLDPQTLETFKKWPARRYTSDAQGAERATLYIRLENFAQDAAPLMAHLGFTFDLGRSNTSVRDADYRSYYTPRLQSAVARACAEDIERFGYSF